jgi:hypothetical protein
MGTAPVSKTPNDINRSIVWLDASVNNTQENVNAQQMLRIPTNHLKTYTDDKSCEKGQLIVLRIHSLVQVSAIFVYCTDKKNEE